MLAVNDITIKNDFQKYCDKVTNENETLIVTRDNEKNVVLMSLEKWNMMEKMLKNSEYLDKIDLSLQQIKDGKIVVKTMEELEEMANE